MSRFKRLSLDEAREQFPLINEEARRALKGGCATCDAHPDITFYSFDEYMRLDSIGEWGGGYVCGIDGYILGTATVTGQNPYCPFHQETIVVRDHCIDCYNEGFDFCRPHEVYFPRLHTCYWCQDPSDGYGYNDIFEPPTEPGTPESPDPAPDRPDINTPTDPVTPADLTDGVDITNTKNFSFNLGEHETFKNQLQSILESNVVLKNLLARFDNGSIHLSFEIGKPDAIAQVTYQSDNLYRITFNEAYIGDTGWHGKPEADNVGYDWSKATTYDEALVVALTHEAIHANHYARYQEAQKEGNEWPDQSAQYLLNEGYSEEFVNIFYVKNASGKWDYEYDTNAKENKMEDYIRHNNHGILDAALNEYRREH